MAYKTYYEILDAESKLLFRDHPHDYLIMPGLIPPAM